MALPLESRPSPPPPILQSDLGKRLAHLSRAIQQVASAVKEPGGGTEVAGAAAAASEAAASEAQRQDASLQRALAEAAERIRDFQRRAAHEAQQLQLEGALEPLRAQHAAEAGRQQQLLAAAEAELGVLRRRAEESETAHSQATGELDAWQRRAGAAQDQLEAALRQHEAPASALQQQLAAASSSTCLDHDDVLSAVGHPPHLRPPLPQQLLLGRLHGSLPLVHMPAAVQKGSGQYRWRAVQAAGRGDQWEGGRTGVWLQVVSVKPPTEAQTD